MLTKIPLHTRTDESSFGARSDSINVTAQKKAFQNPARRTYFQHKSNDSLISLRSLLRCGMRKSTLLAIIAFAVAVAGAHGLFYKTCLQNCQSLSFSRQLGHSPKLTLTDRINAASNFIEYGGWNTSQELVLNNLSRRLERKVDHSRKESNFRRFLLTCFIPSGDLSAEYYQYTVFRAFQRFISSTNNVFSTQALLLALGFRKNRVGLAAATTWVLKDALGKISRVFWASKYGRRFDSDAKKWRFRSALLFAMGNGLEIFTYLFPSYFLVTAAVGNALKQVAMLTSSSTRNTM